jgi:hypothetical protein
MAETAAGIFRGLPAWDWDKWSVFQIQIYNWMLQISIFTDTRSEFCSFTTGGKVFDSEVYGRWRVLARWTAGREVHTRPFTKRMISAFKHVLTRGEYLRKPL